MESRRAHRLIFLPGLRRLEDALLLLLRSVTGAFLLYQSHDNLLYSERMEEFRSFLATHGFIYPHLMAPLSIYAQIACGTLLILGLLTRWAGIVVAINFMVAVWMVHWPQDFAGWWPAFILIFLGLFFAARGAGRYSLDWIAEGRPGVDPRHAFAP